MVGNRELLVDLLSVNNLNGGHMTVTECIDFYLQAKFEKHEDFIASGGFMAGSLDDYLEAWDNFCEDKCVGWVD